LKSSAQLIRGEILSAKLPFFPPVKDDFMRQQIQANDIYLKSLKEIKRPAHCLF
jgi:hypothetical protein